MMKKIHRCSVNEASSYRDCDAELDPATVRDKLSEIAVSFIGSRLDECLVKRGLISASTGKRLRAVEHWSQKRVKRGLFEERFLATSSAALFLAKRAEEPIKNCSCVFQVPPHPWEARLANRILLLWLLSLR
jgi:hypothetical protein